MISATMQVVFVLVAVAGIFAWLLVQGSYDDIDDSFDWTDERW